MYRWEFQQILNVNFNLTNKNISKEEQHFQNVLRVRTTVNLLDNASCVMWPLHQDPCPLGKVSRCLHSELMTCDPLSRPWPCAERQDFIAIDWLQIFAWVN